MYQSQASLHLRLFRDEAAIYPHLQCSVRYSGAMGLAFSSSSRRLVSHTAFPGLRVITSPLKVTHYVPFSSPTVREFPPLLYTSKFRSERNLINEVDNVNRTALLASIEKSALAGHAARDEFYPGALRRTLAVQLHHILVGRPSSWDDNA